MIMLPTPRANAPVATLAGLAVLWLAVAPLAAADRAACNAEPVITGQIACFRDAALAAGDAAICEAADDPVVRFQCLSLYAEGTLDAAPCARIDAGANAAETRALQQACIAGVAVKAGDPALCEDAAIAELRDSCLMMLVTEAGADPALCDRIDNELLREACGAPAPE